MFQFLFHDEITPTYPEAQTTKLNAMLGGERGIDSGQKTKQHAPHIVRKKCSPVLKNMLKIRIY